MQLYKTHNYCTQDAMFLEEKKGCVPEAVHTCSYNIPPLFVPAACCKMHSGASA